MCLSLLLSRVRCHLLLPQKWNIMAIDAGIYALGPATQQSRSTGYWENATGLQKCPDISYATTFDLSNITIFKRARIGCHSCISALAQGSLKRSASLRQYAQPEARASH